MNNKKIEKKIEKTRLYVSAGKYPYIYTGDIIEEKEDQILIKDIRLGLIEINKNKIISRQKVIKMGGRS